MKAKSRARPTRLPRWQEWAVYVTFGALSVTGVVWLALNWGVRIEGEFGPEHHPGEHWALVFHGIAAYAFLIIGGAMIPIHVKLGWSMRRNYKTGLWLGVGCILAAVTGLGLYYIGEDIALSTARIAHWVVGLVVIPALLIHAIRGRSGV